MTYASSSTSFAVGLFFCSTALLGSATEILESFTEFIGQYGLIQFSLSDYYQKSLFRSFVFQSWFFVQDGTIKYYNIRFTDFCLCRLFQFTSEYFTTYLSRINSTCNDQNFNVIAKSSGSYLETGAFLFKLLFKCLLLAVLAFTLLIKFANDDMR